MNRKSLWLAVALIGCQQTPLRTENESDESVFAMHDTRAEFLRLADGDSWARWPPDDAFQQIAERACHRVSESHREEAISRLDDRSAVGIDQAEYRRLTDATSNEPGRLYLLRGFATNHSSARVLAQGARVLTESSALGGLFGLRRYPCIAVLSQPPSEVYAIARYDL